MLHSRDIDGKFYAPNYLNTIVQNNYDETSVNSKCDMKDLLLNHSQYPAVYLVLERQHTLTLVYN